MKSYSVKWEEERMDRILQHWQERSLVKVKAAQVLRALLEKEEEKIERTEKKGNFGGLR